MDGEREDDQRGDAGLHERLRRAERIRGPGGRIGGEVVRVVHHAEQPRVMHQPVGPVEVGIVNQDRDADAEKEPGPAELFDAEIHLGPARRDDKDHEAPDQPIDGHAAEGIEELPAHLAESVRLIADAAAGEPPGQQKMQDAPRWSGDDQIPEPAVDHLAGNGKQGVEETVVEGHAEKARMTNSE